MWDTFGTQISYNNVDGEYSFFGFPAVMDQSKTFDAACAGETLRFTYAPTGAGPSPVQVLLDHGLGGGFGLIGTIGADPLPYDSLVPAGATSVTIRLAAVLPFNTGAFTVPELTVMC